MVWRSEAQSNNGFISIEKVMLSDQHRWHTKQLSVYVCCVIKCSGKQTQTTERRGEKRNDMREEPFCCGKIDVGVVVIVGNL